LEVYDTTWHLSNPICIFHICVYAYTCTLTLSHAHLT